MAIRSFFRLWPALALTALVWTGGAAAASVAAGKSEPPTFKPAAPNLRMPYRLPKHALRTNSYGHPAFFTGEVALDNGIFYLAFPDGQVFGYYSYVGSDSHYIYHFQLGYEYISDAGDTDNGIYLYDFISNGFLYTSPSLYPYLYDFNLNSFLYYFVESSDPRYFYDFSTGQYITD